MFKDEVLDTIKKYNLIRPNDIVIVGVSGGPDSMCLLNVLDELKETLNIQKIIVAHINHMLREESEEETKFVKQFCKDRDIEIYVKYVNIKQIAKEKKLGEEETGRIERYAFFEEIAKKTKANKIATAHNYNDNAETILMHLIRGSGISGLCGIKPEIENKYIRPIIKCKRVDIEKYCADNELKPKYDKSNDDNNYTRNKIRNELIPYLKKEFNPNIIETINRLSELVIIEDNYMNKIVLEQFKDVNLNKGRDKIVIDLSKFNKLETAIKLRMLLYIIKYILGNTNNIEKKNLEDIIKLCERNIGNKYLMPNKNIKIFIKAGKVSFEKVLK